MEDKIVEEMQKHNLGLKEYACSDSEAVFLKENTEDIRTPFFRDIDRIIYSLAFIRYQDKTQVFSKVNHDHIARRMIHVQFVGKIARTIGRGLGLNEDLIEAAALGHDLGHVPFGHVGESILNKISLEEKEGYFYHNIQSVRTLMNIENYGKGLNISIQTLDAIMCHNGEFALGKYEPSPKTKEEFMKEYENCYKDPNQVKKLKPMTLEGCVVRISDLIAYLGRDIDDAVRLKMLKREDIPKNITNILGDNTKDIVNTCILDILKNSYGKNYIELTPQVYEAIKSLMQFNYEYIYNKSESARGKDELEIMFRKLYKSLLNDLEQKNEKSAIISSYLKNMSEEYQKNNSNKRIVIDYIAGMTDDFFLKEYENINN